MERRARYQSCWGPYEWVDHGDMATCGNPGCVRQHQDHIRKLNQDESITDFCLICMANH